MVLCDIIILTWNQLDLTKRVLESILKHTLLPCRVILIDNGSCDGTVDFLKTLNGNATVKIEKIFNKENLGFVRAVNQGMQISQADYICLMNNDCLVTPGWLSRMIEVARSTPQIGIVNPASNTLGIRPARNQSIDDYNRQIVDYKNEYVELDSCVGFCMLIKRELIEKVGYLSEEFSPLFFEDTDYSMRAKQAGYINVMAKASYVWHDEHGSVRRLVTKKKEEIFRSNRKKFEAKWGKWLRIAFITDYHIDSNKFKSLFSFTIRLARISNYVSIFVPLSIDHHRDKERKSIFDSVGGIENANIQFFPAQLCIWKILTKKKRYDLVVAIDGVCVNILRFLKFLHKAQILRLDLSNPDWLIEFCKKERFINFECPKISAS